MRHPFASRTIFVNALLAGVLSLSVSGSAVGDAESGRRIYREGLVPHERGITASIGGDQIPAALVPCASCHGPDGRGRAEGGVVPSDVNWRELTKPYRTATINGRRRPAYTDESIGRAIRAGVDSAGNALNSAMPRYVMSDADMADLIAYLKVMANAAAPGVSDDTIRVATMVPASGAGAAAGRQMAAVLSAALSEAGEIHGRRVELDVVQLPPDPSKVRSELQTLLRTRPPFAFVGGLVSGIDTTVAEVVEEGGVPVVLPAGATADRSSANEQRFYLDPALEDQLAGLVRFTLEDRELRRRAVAIVGRGSAAVRARRAVALADPTLAVVVIDSTAEDAGEQISAAIRDGLAIAFTDPTVAIGPLLGKAGAHRDAVLLFLGGVLPPDFFQTPTLSSYRVRIALAAAPEDFSSAGLSEYRAFVARHGIESHHAAAQISAYVAAKVFVHALQSSGRGITRDAVRLALEGLYEFRTGVSPPLTFGRRGRVAVTRMRVATLDPSTGRVSAIGEYAMDR